jgi:O-antigen/teichoic acid export membrane protein
VLGYAVLASMSLWLLAPLAPWLLGPGFDYVTPLLRALCLVVITSSLRQCVTALLTTRDLQASRNMIEIGGVCLSIAFLMILVPCAGAYGAVAAIACADVAVSALGAKALLKRRSNSRATHE